MCYYVKVLLLFFLLYEGVGMVVFEVMVYGVFNFSYDNYGFGEIVGVVGMCIFYSNYEESILVFVLFLMEFFYYKEFCY